MDVLGRIFGGGGLYAGVPGPADDWWYRPVGESMLTPAGMRVDEETAQKLSAWYRGRDILATVLAMLPFPIYQRLPNDGGSEPALEHPLYDVLHDRPNDFQDSFQWRRAQMFDLIDHGHAYDWIVPGARGFVHQLVPIEPTLVTPRQQGTTLANGARIPGRELFDVRDPQTGRTSTFTQDEVFHLRGAGGKGILEYARSSLGTALATETYAGQIFSRGTLSGGVLELPGTLDTEVAKAMAESFRTAGRDWHMPKVLEQGATYTPSKMSPEDFQMLLSRKFGVDDMARWTGVPRQMLENSDPSFGNAEQFWQGFLTVGMGGWLSLFEFGVNGQLILQPKKYYAQFTRQALMRGNFKDRIEGLVLAAGGPILTTDEARQHEDLNKLGGKAAALRENQNVTGKPAAADPTPAPTRTPASTTKAEAIVLSEASRILRTEIAFVQKAAVKHAADPVAFASAIAAFYGSHAGFVVSRLELTNQQAITYCDSQAAQITTSLGGWVAALERWATSAYAAGLAALALEEAA